MEFSLTYTERNSIVFDIPQIQDHEIDVTDIDPNLVEKDMFVAFCNGFLEKTGFGGRTHFTAHPQLSNKLIEALPDKEIPIIGIDFSGIRRIPEHIPMDQRCADRGVFVIGNLCNLREILNLGGRFIACTYPMN